MKEKEIFTEAFVRFIVLPTLFLMVAALGGVRTNAETGAFIFLAPPLITLLLAVLLMLLVVRGKLVDLASWLSSHNSILENTAHVLTLAALFFASAQALNSVLPERGLLHWMFSFFFLWTLWNNLWSPFAPKQLLRSLVVLFATAFVIKHLLLANLYAPDAGWLQRITGVLLEGVSLGTLGVEHFAASTGYISFFAIALYTLGLLLLPCAPGNADGAESVENLAASVNKSQLAVALYRQLSSAEQTHVREAVTKDGKLQLQESAPPKLESSDRANEAENNILDAEVEEVTIVRERND
ncbi:MAG: hypothetical protein WKF74_14980 [Pyrinomonadaceae bacterium]